MKTFAGFFIVFLAMVCWPNSMKAQDVTIPVPVTNIFDRTEFSTVENVLYTDKPQWERSGHTIINPTFNATSSAVFRHHVINGLTLPADVLQNRLKSIGGFEPPFHNQDIWPGFKIFTTSPQTWYEPGQGNHHKGNLDFTFKIPASQFVNNVFQAGNYAMEITHNYTGQFHGHFTPEIFNIVISVPSAISWLTNTPTKYIEISSLNEYRSTSVHLLGDLGAAEIANTVDFDLWAKASSSNIQFTSSKGVQGNRNISDIRLGSTDPKLTTKALSPSSQKYSSNPFEVETGNRNNFTLQLSVSATDFKNYFFEAGTYTFQLNLDAKSTDNTVSALQNTDVTIEVPPLSEIVIPASGQTVNFNFNTGAHYKQGQSKVMPNQIKLSNNENFELYVKSGTSFFKKAGIQSDIESDILQIGVDGNPLQIPLSITPQKIILNETPVLDQKFDIKYTIPANSAQGLMSKEKTTYSIDVIYSFTAL